jgi:hypothetical protein
MGYKRLFESTPERDLILLKKFEEDLPGFMKSLLSKGQYGKNFQARLDKFLQKISLVLKAHKDYKETVKSNEAQQIYKVAAANRLDIKKVLKGREDFTFQELEKAIKSLSLPLHIKRIAIRNPKSANKAVSFTMGSGQEIIMDIASGMITINGKEYNPVSLVLKDLLGLSQEDFDFYVNFLSQDHVLPLGQKWPQGKKPEAEPGNKPVNPLKQTEPIKEPAPEEKKPEENKDWQHKTFA